MHFLLSDLVTASGGTIPGSLAGFTPEQIAVFCSILNTFTSEYIKDF